MNLFLMNRGVKILFVFCTVFSGGFLLSVFAALHLIVEKPLKNAGAIMVLAGSSTYVERTQKAAELYKQGVASRIFLTDDGARAGWSKAEQKNPRFVELARKSLIESGVAPEAIEILNQTVDGTKSEADALQKKAAQSDLKSILLVTSAYHSRRALRTFEKTFNDNKLSVEIGIASPAPGFQTPTPFLWLFSPKGWRLVAGEYVKSVYYWIYY